MLGDVRTIRIATATGADWPNCWVTGTEVQYGLLLHRAPWWSTVSGSGWGVSDIATGRSIVLRGSRRLVLRRALLRLRAIARERGVSEEEVLRRSRSFCTDDRPRGRA